MMMVSYDIIIKYDKIWNNILKMRQKFAKDLTESLLKKDPKFKKHHVIFIASWIFQRL